MNFKMPLLKNYKTYLITWNKKQMKAKKKQ